MAALFRERTGQRSFVSRAVSWSPAREGRTRQPVLLTNHGQGERQQLIYSKTKRLFWVAVPQLETGL